MSHFSLTQGRHAAGQKEIVGLPRLWKANYDKPAVIWCHGRGFDATVGYAENYTANVARAICDAGYPYIAIDAGSVTQWGNPVAIGYVLDAIAFAENTLKARVGKHIVMGFSMGGQTALNTGDQHPERVAAVIGICPAVSLPYLAASDVNMANEIAAMHGANWNTPAVLNEFSPLQAAQDSTDRFTIPIQIHRASDDNVVGVQQVADFCTATGCQQLNMGAVGHTPQFADPNAIVSFIKANT